MWNTIKGFCVIKKENNWIQWVQCKMGHCVLNKWNIGSNEATSHVSSLTDCNNIRKMFRQTVGENIRTLHAVLFVRIKCVEFCLNSVVKNLKLAGATVNTDGSTPGTTADCRWCHMIRSHDHSGFFLFCLLNLMLPVYTITGSWEKCELVFLKAAFSQKMEKGRLLPACHGSEMCDPHHVVNDGWVFSKLSEKILPFVLRWWFGRAFFWFFFSEDFWEKNDSVSGRKNLQRLQGVVRVLRTCNPCGPPRSVWVLALTLSTTVNPSPPPSLVGTWVGRTYRPTHWFSWT